MDKAEINKIILYKNINFWSKLMKKELNNMKKYSFLYL